jgi:multidrug efflux system outer membrane protein
VEDTLISIQKLRELLAVQDREIAALEEYSAVARNRYDAGYAMSYLEILDADRNYYAVRIEQTQTREELFAALVKSYKAMGGGWESASDSAKP